MGREDFVPTWRRAGKGFQTVQALGLVRDVLPRGWRILWVGSWLGESFLLGSKV